MTVLLHILAIPVGIIALLLLFFIIGAIIEYFEYFIAIVLIAAIGYVLGSAIFDGLNWI